MHLLSLLNFIVSTGLIMYFIEVGKFRRRNLTSSPCPAVVYLTKPQIGRSGTIWQSCGADKTSPTPMDTIQMIPRIGAMCLPMVHSPLLVNLNEVHNNFPRDCPNGDR